MASRSAIVEIYCRQVLPFKARKIPLLGRKCSSQIMYTFLGYEVKTGRRRITCPDLVTARYLKVFLEIGMKQVLIPYDPTRTARLIDRLEKDFERLKAAAEGAALRAEFARVRRGLLTCEARSGS